MSKGFTIVELMVSITIIALMAGSVFFNWRPTEQTFALVRSAHQLADDLRRTQQMAVSTKVFTCSETDSDYSGYGLYLNTNQATGYLIFENCDNDNWLYSEETDVILETQDLESGVQIQSLTVDDPTSVASVLFVPPNPKVYINGVGVGKELIIVLELIDDITRTKEIKINTSGRIEIN